MYEIKPGDVLTFAKKRTHTDTVPKNVIVLDVQLEKHECTVKNYDSPESKELPANIRLVYAIYKKSTTLTEKYKAKMLKKFINE